MIRGLQANRKTREGANHPDRDAQFRYINDSVKAALGAGEPAISVDTKKKELVGDFKNAGREWLPKGSPEEVRAHDFLIPELGRAAPYGVYDIRQRFEALSPVLDERSLRRFAAAEAQAAGHGGVSAVNRVTGLARSTIGRRLKELSGERPIVGERVRRLGGGRKPLVETDASLLDDLRSLVEPSTRGDPQSPLLWTCKSLRNPRT